MSASRLFSVISVLWLVDRLCGNYNLVNTVRHAFGVDDAAHSLGLPMAGFLCTGRDVRFANRFLRIVVICPLGKPRTRSGRENLIRLKLRKPSKTTH